MYLREAVNMFWALIGAVTKLGLCICKFESEKVSASPPRTSPHVTGAHTCVCVSVCVYVCVCVYEHYCSRDEQCVAHRIPSLLLFHVHACLSRCVCHFLTD